MGRQQTLLADAARQGSCGGTSSRNAARNPSPTSRRPTRLQVLARIWHAKPERARRVRQRSGAMMKWAVAMEHRADNPAGEALGAALGRQQDVVRHMPALPHVEVAAAVEAVRASGAWAGTKLAFEYLVLTVARSAEVRLATWGEIDLDAAVWTVPGSRMKAKRAHRMPLCDRAAAIVHEAEALRGNSASPAGALVFPKLPRLEAIRMPPAQLPEQRQCLQPSLRILHQARHHRLPHVRERVLPRPPRPRRLRRRRQPTAPPAARRPLAHSGRRRGRRQRLPAHLLLAQSPNLPIRDQPALRANGQCHTRLDSPANRPILLLADRTKQLSLINPSRTRAARPLRRPRRRPQLRWRPQDPRLTNPNLPVRQRL